MHNYGGYPAETHWVTTDDGYILTIHRIPYGKLNRDLQAHTYIEWSAQHLSFEGIHFCLIYSISLLPIILCEIHFENVPWQRLMRV